MTQLQGEVELVTAPHPVVGGTLRIRLVDVSRADAPATVIAEVSIPNVTMQSVADRIGFILDGPDLDPAHSHALEAHLDATGSGETSVGDYRTMEHIGVSAATAGDTFSIRLRPVI